MPLLLLFTLAAFFPPPYAADVDAFEARFAEIEMIADGTSVALDMDEEEEIARREGLPVSTIPTPAAVTRSVAPPPPEASVRRPPPWR